MTKGGQKKAVDIINFAVNKEDRISATTALPIPYPDTALLRKGTGRKKLLRSCCQW